MFQCIFFALSLAAGQSVLDNDCKETLRSAISGHGGRESLQKLLNYHVKYKGVVRPGDGRELPFKSELWFRAPNSTRFEMTLEIESQRFFNLVVVSSGSNYWQKVDGKLIAATKSRIDVTRQNQFESRLMALYTLLEDKDLKIRNMGESIVEGRSMIRLGVNSPEYSGVELMFDKKTKRLSALVSSEKEEDGKRISVQTYFNDYKDFQGVQYPTRVVRTRGDVKTIEDVEYFSPLQDNKDIIFSMP